MDLIGSVLAKTELDYERTSDDKRPTQTITIMDHTRHSIDVNYWGDNAELAALKQYDVVVFKTVRLKSYNKANLVANSMSFTNLDDYSKHEGVKSFCRWLAGMPRPPKFTINDISK